MPTLTNKVALVTGASTGIGAAIAIALAAAGASVVVNYAHSQADADNVVATIASAGGHAIAVQADVSIASECQALVSAVLSKYARLDILVNNAGIYRYAPLEAITEADFHAHFNLNVLGTLLVTKAASPHFTSGASVINIGSSITRENPPSSAVYSATKASINAITGVLSKELGPRGIRVNSINPGMVDVPRRRDQLNALETRVTGLIARTPLGRIGQPNDIAPVAVFLASDDAHWITGELIHVSGGL
ncbi:3-oxoacyl-[acyl-carrier protein] reductase [Bryocella elongata]|uniref:3-oxoacyl-[acyl-carrier protein] reductase n=1 Tax=Bryocella elongata TaxID=863522 RepID=A0A1H6B2G0_9BACT|nr:glucose 1-dehydrogenase [Bryocella elongata]SEG55061.1 3-oxoacyl-[acyl-carrier protein] reductase [Bryocella elongata]